MAFSERVQGDLKRFTPTDESLVSAYVENGDERAFRILVERHQERVFGFLLGMVRDREVANDLFQETYIRVISALQKQRASYTQQGKFLGWTLKIARNAALDYLRTQKRWQDVSGSSDEDESSYWERLPDDAPLMDTLMHDSEQKDFLNSCIDNLPPDQREVLLLRHEGDLTFREISELTDCSINTALGRMRYALLNLRRMMASSEKKDLTEVSQ